MRRIVVLPVLAALAFLAPAAFATTARPKEVRCPVCGKTITVLQIGSTNSFGGPDFDFCGHAVGEEPRTLRIWTCPHCLYSRYGGAFEEGVDEEAAKRIREELKPPCPIEPGAGQRDIPAWAKYRLALAVARWAGDSPGDLADLALSGAWATRADPCRGDNLGPATRGDPMVQEALSAAAGDVAESSEALMRCRMDLRAADLLVVAALKMPDGAEERDSRILCAGALRRFRGEDARMGPMLRAIAGDTSAPEEHRRMAELLLASAEREREFLAEFFDLSTATMEDDGTDGDFRAVLPWLRAEALRRLGRAEEAAAAREAALVDETLAPWLRPLIPEVLSALDLSIPEERQREIDAKWREGALARLTDPATADGAYRELRVKTDPLALPAIVRALAHEDPRVRACAALTLKFYEDPGPEAVEALLRMAAEEKADLPREKVLFALAEICSPLCREYYEKVLTAPPGDGAERAVEPLGNIGTEGTVPLLLAHRMINASRVDVALARLTNRACEAREPFATWYAEHEEEGRTAWVLAGFREAGYEIADLATDDAVPVLLSALSDERDHVRWNAFRALREKTGLSIGRDAFTESYSKPHELKAAVARWRRHFAR